MFVIRPIQKSDYESLYHFAALARGMTSLIKDEKTLQKLIENSITSFSHKGIPPTREYYLFVLEEHYGENEKTVCGVSAIKAMAGADKPLHFYRVDEKYLVPVHIEHGPSELCSLYLLSDYRKEGLGKLLSLSRLHFIAAFTGRFQTSLMAELRGYIDENKHSPFWDYFGKSHPEIEYEQAEFLIAKEEFNIKSLMAKQPVLISELPEEVRNTLGKTHMNTVPALKMLKDEGFEWSGGIDIIDGGPLIAAEVSKIRTVHESEVVEIEGIYEQPLSEMPLQGETWIISNNRLDFRAVLSQVERSGSGIELPAEVLEGLKLKIGDTVRISRLNPKE